MRSVMRPDAVSLTRIGCIVAMSEIVPSMIRPPFCGCSEAAAVGLAVVCPPVVHAVAMRIAIAPTTGSAVMVRCCMPLFCSFPERETPRV